MNSRELIIDEIKKVAARNGGVAPGWKLFRSETGMSESSWRGRYWSKWSDALVDAGFKGNEFAQPYKDEELFLAFIGVARKLGRLPTSPEYKLAARQDSNLPSFGAFRRIGLRADILQRLAEFVKDRTGFEDIVQLCVASQPAENSAQSISAVAAVAGYVYLMKHGQHYKIGRTNDTARRRREVSLLLPEELKHIHVIETDDPEGIEGYWHRRFADKRVRGEWFSLTAQDLAAFKRRRYQ